MPDDKEILDFLFARAEPGTIPAHRLDTAVSEGAYRFSVSKDYIFSLMETNKLIPKDAQKSGLENARLTKMIDLRGKMVPVRIARIRIAKNFMGENLRYADGAQKRAMEALKKAGFKKGCNKGSLIDDRFCLVKVGVVRKNQIDPISFEGICNLSIPEKIEIVKARIAENQRKLEILRSGKDVEI
jgi:hypothetical protein